MITFLLFIIALPVILSFLRGLFLGFCDGWDKQVRLEQERVRQAIAEANARAKENDTAQKNNDDYGWPLA